MGTRQKSKARASSPPTEAKPAWWQKLRDRKKATHAARKNALTHLETLASSVEKPADSPESVASSLPIGGLPPPPPPATEPGAAKNDKQKGFGQEGGRQEQELQRERKAEGQGLASEDALDALSNATVWKVPAGYTLGEVGIHLKANLMESKCNLGKFAKEFSVLASIALAGGSPLTEDLFPMPLDKFSAEEKQWEDFKKVHKRDWKEKMEAEESPRSGQLPTGPFRLCLFKASVAAWLWLVLMALNFD
jgi:hypothetical protein